MASDAATSYLTREVAIGKNVVTYRSLSRKLNIHVNTAKNELASFLDHRREGEQRVYATYLVSGYMAASSGDHVPILEDDAMDVDCAGDRDDDFDDVEFMKLVLVGESDLDEVKAEFAQVTSCHVYCLSPSPLRDAAHICDPTVSVRLADSQIPPGTENGLGQVVSPLVKMRTSSKKSKASTSSKTLPGAKASSSLLKPPPVTSRGTAAQAPAAASKPKVEEKPSTAAAPLVLKEKPKGGGKLDWSRAKPEEAVKTEPEATKLIFAEKADAKTNGDSAPASTPGSDSSKRGTKRKSEVVAHDDTETRMDTDVKLPSESAPKQSAAPAGARVQKRAIVSDDEDDSDASVKSKSKAGSSKPGRSRLRKAAISFDDSDDESEPVRSVRAMMDIDDEQVTKASQKTKRPATPSDDEDGDQADEAAAPDAMEVDDVDEDSDPAMNIKAKARKRREKKVIPIGKNGLKKKRVMREKQSMDAKGYLVTTEYSSYESASEEEEPAPPKKGRAPSAKATSTKSKPEPFRQDAAPEAKPAAPKAETKKIVAPERKPSKSSNTAGGQRKSSAGGAGSLMNYFGGGAKAKKT